MQRRMLLGILLLAVILSGNAATGQCVLAPAGLSHWWPGDDLARDTVGDYDGTLLGGAGFGPGKVQRAFAFDGFDDYVGIDACDMEPCPLSGPFTLELWWSTLSNGRHTLIGSGKGGANRDYLQIRDNLRYKYRFSAEEDSAVSVDAAYLSDGTFYHVALTRDDQNDVRLYHNGELLNVDPGNALDFRISNLGRVGDNWNIMSGLVDEVSWYDRALSDGEILAIYNAGSAGKCPCGGGALSCDIFEDGFESGDTSAWK